jgi:hypothetical protein
VDFALGQMRCVYVCVIVEDGPSYEWAGKVSPCRSPCGLPVRSNNRSVPGKSGRLKGLL